MPAAQPFRLLDVYGWAMAVVALLSAPLSAWLGPEHGSVRFAQVGLTVALAVAFAWRRGAVDLSVARSTRWALFVAFLALFGLAQAAKFDAFLTSGTDFTTYDRMLFNTWHGAFGYTPIYTVNHFGVHLNYLLLPLVLLHRAWESPGLLLTVNTLALWGAAFPLWALAERRWSRAGALLLVLAYWTNPWLDRLVDGGFKPEAFYPLLGLTFVLAWDFGSTRAWVAAALAYLCIKEDAALHLGAFAAASVLVDRGTWKRAATLAGLSVAVLLLGALVVQPAMLRGYRDLRVFSLYWPQYGTTLGGVAWGMARAPLTLATDVLTSSWYRVLLPALLLPLFRWRSALPLLPTIVMLGSTRYGMMRNYDWYYSVPLLAFVFLGFLEVVRRDRPRARWVEPLVASAVLLFPLVGVGYLRFPEPVPEVSAGYEVAVASLAASPGTVCVQLAAFPRLPYAIEGQPLTSACLAAPARRALINLAIDPWPDEPGNLERLLALAGPRAHAFPGGWVIVEGPVEGW